MAKDIMEFSFGICKKHSLEEKLSKFDKAIDKIQMLRSVTMEDNRIFRTVTYGYTPDNCKTVGFEVDQFNATEFLISVKFELEANEVIIKIMKISDDLMIDENSLNSINFIVQTFKNMVKDLNNE